MIALAILILLDNYTKTGVFFQIDQALHHETIALIFFTISLTTLALSPRNLKLGWREFRKITGGILTALGLWLWWESYKMTVIWQKRMELFPMPFYAFWLPHYAVVDLAILLVLLAYIWGVLD